MVHRPDQTYLRTTPARMQAALAHADANSYSFGAKLVRGAYVESERAKWAREGRHGDCIVWNNKQETDACFDSCAGLLERRIADEVKLELVAAAGGAESQPQNRLTTTAAFYASHNGTSMKKVLEALRRDGLARETDDGMLEIDDRLRGRISFGQLYGGLIHCSVCLILTLVVLVADPVGIEPTRHERQPDFGTRGHHRSAVFKRTVHTASRQQVPSLRDDRTSSAVPHPSVSPNLAKLSYFLHSLPSPPIVSGPR